MFSVVSSVSTVDSYLASIFGENRSSIVDLQNKWFNEEAYKGTSKYPYKVAMYYMATYLVLIMWLEIKAGYETDWDYYKEKYKIDDNRKKLACCGIDLDDVLAAFGLNVQTTGACIAGINSMEVEECLVIEPTTLPTVAIITIGDVVAMLTTPNECISYIN